MFCFRKGRMCAGNPSRVPCSKKKRHAKACLFFLEVTPGFEPGSEGFADLCLTTWPRHHIQLKHKERGAAFLICHFGAGDEARTRYLHLGKVALYQMSYTRKWCLRSELNQRHADFQSAALPTELQRHVEVKNSPHFKWRPGTDSNRRPPA